jgi:hypothetical protein
MIVEASSYYLKFHFTMIIVAALYRWVSHYKEFNIVSRGWRNDIRSFPPDIITIIQTRRIYKGWACSNNRIKRNEYKILLRKTERKGPFLRSGCRWADNIKMDFKYCGRFWTKIIYLRVENNFLLLWIRHWTQKFHKRGDLFIYRIWDVHIRGCEDFRLLGYIV